MKILVQKQVTVTLELNYDEAVGLTKLINSGTGSATAKELHLLELGSVLAKNFPEAKKENGEGWFKETAVLK